MPCTSKKQCAFMGAIIGGKIKKKELSVKKAKEFVRGDNAKTIIRAVSTLL